MADFTETSFIHKLQELDSSRDSIQTLSLWLKHHRKHHAVVVEIWFRELLKAQDNRQLIFMYLANAVLQMCKKKGPEYGQEFGKVLVDSFKHIAKTGVNKKTKHSLHKILTKWQVKGVYDAQKIKQYKEAVDTAVVLPQQACKRKSTEVEVKGQPEKKAKVEARPKQENASETIEVDGHLEATVEAMTKQAYATEMKEVDGHSEAKLEARLNQENTIETKEDDGHPGTHNTTSLTSPPGLSMNPEELIKALMELDSCGLMQEELVASQPSTSGRQSSSTFEEAEVEEQPANNANEEAGANQESRSETDVNGHHETHTTSGPTTSTGRAAKHDEILQALFELEARDESMRNINITLPLSIPGGDIFSKLDGKVTPYFRINYVINLVRELRKLSLVIQYLKRNACQCTCDLP